MRPGYRTRAMATLLTIEEALARGREPAPPRPAEGGPVAEAAGRVLAMEGRGAGQG